MSNKLTDMQLVLLSAAWQRDDHCLTLPTGVQRGSARKAAAKLLEAGLVKEVRARKDAPMWRRDEETEQPFALKLTAAGLKAIAPEANEDSVEAAPTVDDAVSSRRPESFLAAETGAVFAMCPPRSISYGRCGLEPRHLTRFGMHGSAPRGKTNEQGRIVPYACAGAWSSSARH